jgi:copper(I)-binding protein
MKALHTLLLVSLLNCVLFGGCNSESDTSDSANSNNVVFGKLELSNGWARPGSEGQTSAVYLTISNGTASTDTLLEINSEVANSAELHISKENEDGTTSMRPAGKQVIRDGHKLQVAPGGLHIMLMDLNRNLAVGDSISISLEFARVGSKTLRIPVQTND